MGTAANRRQQTVSLSTNIDRKRREWHDEHKLAVLRSRGHLDEDEDKPIWADMR